MDRTSIQLPSVIISTLVAPDAAECRWTLARCFSLARSRGHQIELSSGGTTITTTATVVIFSTWRFSGAKGANSFSDGPKCAAAAARTHDFGVRTKSASRLSSALSGGRGHWC